MALEIQVLYFCKWNRFVDTANVLNRMIRVMWHAKKRIYYCHRFRNVEERQSTKFAIIAVIKFAF